MIERRLHPWLLDPSTTAAAGPGWLTATTMLAGGGWLFVTTLTDVRRGDQATAEHLAPGHAAEPTISPADQWLPAGRHSALLVGVGDDSQL